MRKATLTALLWFIVLSLVLTYPLALHLTGAVEDRQDALLNVWITAWDGHQLLSDPLYLFDANIFYPYPRTLAYSELLLGNALLALPITLATGNPVLGYNVVLLLSFVLSGLGTYLLVLKLTRSPGAGLVAGTIFAFASYRLTNLAQAQLLTTQWLPLALLSLYGLLRRPCPRHVATFVLFTCLQALSSFYYAILLALAVLGWVLFEVTFWLWSSVVRRPSSTAHRPASISGRPSSLPYLLLAAGCCILIVLPFALPYFRVQRDLGFERSLADSEPFSASLRQYLMVAPGSVIHGWWLPSDDAPRDGGYPVDALFPGLVALALGAWGLARGQGRTRWFFLLLLLASFLLSLGPRLYLAPSQPAGLEFPLPYAWFYAVVPGFKALRAPVRFDALVMLALSVLAGYGVSALPGSVRQARSQGQDRMGTRAQTKSTGATRTGLLATSFLLLLVGVESLVWPAANAQPVPIGDEVPALYRWLAGQVPGPILELPMAFTAGGPQLDYQYLSTYHWHTTPDGYSGFIPPKHGQIVYEMERFPWERGVSLLQALGVRYVVLHADRYPPSRWLDIQAALAQVGDLTQVEAFGADHVYEVAPRSFDPVNLQVTGYFPSRALAGEGYTAYVLALNGGLRSHALQPTDVLRPAVVWRGPGGSVAVDTTADLPLVTSPDGGAAVISIPLTAPTTPGLYELSIGAGEGPLGAWTLASSVDVGQQGDSDFPVPVRLQAWNLPSTARPGEALPVGLTWRALGKIDAYYSLYVKLLDAGGNAVAGWDGQPRNGEAPTLFWVPGETVDDVVTLNLPADMMPGDYLVEVGMYRAEDLARCLTLTEDGTPLDHVVLGRVRIQP